LILSDVENHHRLVNELAERVANLEALSENPDVSDSLADVQTRYDKVRNRARVCSYYFIEEKIQNSTLTATD
jgi:hypothetical protein